MDNSGYKISIQSDYVLVERHQNYEVNVNVEPAMLMELSSVCQEADCRNALILGPRTKVNIAELGLRIAIVESHDALTEDVNFLENAVWNRGGHIRFFDSEMEAKYWLQGS